MVTLHHRKAISIARTAEPLSTPSRLAVAGLAALFPAEPSKADAVREAGAVFRRYQRYCATFDVRLADLYAPDAVIDIVRSDRRLGLTAQGVRRAIRLGMPIARLTGDRESFSGVVAKALSNDRVEIRAVRHTLRRESSMPYLAVLARRSARWLIVYERQESGARPA